MYVLTSSQIKKAERKCIEEIGIPEIVLMENAGFSVFEEIKKDFANLHDKKALVVCGLGNNGGDGLVCARYLSEQVKELVVLSLGIFKTEASQKNFSIFQKMGGNIIILDDEKKLDEINFDYFDIIVDAIFGFGINKEIDGLFKQVIERINKTSAFIYSIDLPSGADADTGKILGTCVKASKTITFSYPKIGNILFPASYYNGQIVVKDIGIPEMCFDQDYTRIIEKSELSTSQFYRFPNTHKGNYGRLGIIGGSQFYMGAGILCSWAAYKMGCGLTFLFTSDKGLTMRNIPSEIITIPIKTNENGYIEFQDFIKYDEMLNKMNVLAFGPGLTPSNDTKAILKHILSNFEIPIIIDADGINVLTDLKKEFIKYSAPKIITPHLGEASRLINRTVEEISSNLIKTAQHIADEYNCVCVLKSARTVISDGEKIYINITGNAGLSKGGSGDVLCGVISSLVAQGFNVLDAANIGVFILGQTAEILARDVSLQSMTPSMIIENLNNVILEIMR